MFTLLPVFVILFIAAFFAFWYLQLFTRYFSTRYYEQVGLLVGIGVLSLCVGIGLLTAPSVSLGSLVLFALLFIVAAYHIGLAIAKLQASDTRYRRFYKANRSVVRFDMPHHRFTVQTEDGQKIQVVKLSTPESETEKAVIVCHGAGRSKNTFPMVQTSELLATRYSVFTFDFRGHMESSGIFRINGDTEYDLKAVIEHIQREGYKKIAVVGWSIGAWTALLSASRGRLIDAIVAGAPPPGQVSSISYVKALEKLKFSILKLPFLAGTAVLRNLWTLPMAQMPQIDDFICRLPPIPILLMYNDFDYTVKETGDVFEALFDKLPTARREKMRLPGRGHFFDWPNTYFVWNKILDWLEKNF